MNNYLSLVSVATARHPVDASTFLEAMARSRDEVDFSELCHWPQNWRENALKDHDHLTRLGARWTWPGHSDYPDWLTDLDDPPTFLSYLGSPCWKSPRRISVVGSREISPQAEGWVRRELTPLCKEGFVLFSGGARGVDQAAHWVAITAGCPTGAFMPSGLGDIYPREFSSMIPKIIERGGAVISELPPAANMRRHYFEKRNRMIAAISSVVVVAQAGRRSGSTMTARLAAELNRTVAVVPGFPGDPWWSGSADLLTSGALPIRDSLDLRTALSRELSIPYQAND